MSLSKPAGEAAEDGPASSSAKALGKLRREGAQARVRGISLDDRDHPSECRKRSNHFIAASCPTAESLCLFE